MLLPQAHSAKKASVLFLLRFLSLFLALSAANAFASEKVPIAGVDLKDQDGNALQIRMGELQSSADAEVLKEAVAAEVKALTGDEAGAIPVPEAKHWLERPETRIGFLLIRAASSPAFLGAKLAHSPVYAGAAASVSASMFLVYFPIGVAEPFFQKLTGNPKYHIYNWGRTSPINAGAAASFFAGSLNWTGIAVLVGELNALLRDQIFQAYDLPGTMDFLTVLSAVALGSSVQAPWAWLTYQWTSGLLANGVPKGQVLGTRYGMALISAIFAIVGSNLVQMGYTTEGAVVLSVLGAGDLIFAGSLYRREIKGFYKKARSRLCRFFVAGHGNSP